jgi:multidrug efflux pump subunit AcrA (membrane-fusion protein)
MSSDYDAAEFIDGDFQGKKSPGASPSTAAGSTPRAPTREEVDSKVAEAQQKLAELRRVQEDLERERAALEETRRRQREFQTGRVEMIQNLTRGLGLLEEAEFAARRDAEQMAKALADLRDALAKVQAINEETWTQDNFNAELTRALTTLENARMEWNSARLKFPVVSGQSAEPLASAGGAQAGVQSLFANHSFSDWCRLSFAVTWPLAAVVALALLVLVILLARR